VTGEQEIDMVVGQAAGGGCDSVVLGVGNTLLGDDGVGIVVAQQVEAARVRGDPGVPIGTRVIDGGTLGPDLVPFLDGAVRVVVVDAFELGASPGTVAVLRNGAVSGAVPGRGLAGRGGLGELIDLVRASGAPPAELILIGIQPGSVGPGLELSAPVAAAVDLAVTMVRRELDVPVG
jgi:hydrogenase maturation protease